MQHPDPAVSVYRAGRKAFQYANHAHERTRARTHTQLRYVRERATVVMCVFWREWECATR